MSATRYHPFMRILHWFMALTIVSLFAVGLYMHGLESEDPLRPTLYGLHKSFGALILLLVFVRIITRLVTRTPTMPPRFATWEKRLAHMAHFSLYTLMFAVPTAGIWMSNSWGHGVSMFGLKLPRIFPENREIGPLASDTHEILAYTIIGVASLHALGALKHRFIDKHDILYRMTFGRIPSHAEIVSDDESKSA